MTSRRYALTAAAMALVCVSFVAGVGTAVAPPDAFVSGWLTLLGLLVAVPASVAYHRRGGSPGALWRYVLAVAVCSLVASVFLAPLLILLDSAALFRGPSSALVALAVHAAAFVAVYRGGWAALKRGFAGAVRRR